MGGVVRLALTLRQHFTTLQLMKNAAEWPPQELGRYWVQNCPHLTVAGDSSNLVDAVQILRFLASALVKSEQRRVFEREHGKAAHQCINQGDLDVTRAMIRHRREITANGIEQGICIEVCAHFDFVEFLNRVVATLK